MAKNELESIDNLKTLTTTKNEVSNFILRFHVSKDIDEVFTTGCCFWYAKILEKRFIDKHPVIMYDEIEGHFGTKIEETVFDITGDVTNKYKWTAWDKVDPIRRSRITKDCIMF